MICDTVDASFKNFGDSPVDMGIFISPLFATG